MINLSRLIYTKYSIDNIKILFSDGTNSTINALNIGSIIYNNDYFNSFLPVFGLECVLDRDLYRKINEDNNAKFFIRMYKSNHKVSGEISGKTENTIQKVFIDDYFISINSDISPFRDNNIYERKNADEKQNKLEKMTEKIEIYLYRENDLHDYRKQLNNVLEKDGVGITVTEAVIATCKLCNKKKVLLSPPDNKNTYKQIIIPPSTMIGAIYNIQSIYGIYNKSLMIYNDLDALYILNKDIKSSTYKQYEIFNIFFEMYEKDVPSGTIPGFYINVSNMSCVININNNIDISNNNVIQKELECDSYHILNTKNGKTDIVNMNLNTVNNNNYKIIDNRFDNEFAISSLKHDVELGNKVVTLSLEGIDTDLLKPNKEYYFNIKVANKTDDKKSGVYRLAKKLSIFTKGGDNYYSIQNTLEFVAI